MSNESNVGLGMVPHRKGCRCNECEVERLTAERAKATAELEECKRQFAQSVCKYEGRIERLEAELEQSREDWAKEFALHGHFTVKDRSKSND